MRSTKSAQELVKKYDNLYHKSSVFYYKAYLIEGLMLFALCFAY